MTSNRPAALRPPSEDAAGILLIRLTVLAGLIGGLARTWADPDLWGHVRFGADMIRDHALTRTDPYSFTSDIPWVNHEWLAEALMALAFSVGGGPGLIVLKLTAIALTLGCVYAAVRHTMSGSARDLVLFAAALGLWSRVFVVRPQLFSVALFAVLLWVIVSAERGCHRRMWLLPVIFGLWVNLHGGWIVGLGALGLWGTVAVSRWRHGRIPASLVVASAALAALATLVNPYGYELWNFLATTVRVDRPNISDWRPLIEADAQVIIPWLLTAGMAVVAVVRGGRQIPLAHAALAIGLGLASVRVSRLDVFFTLSVAVLLGPYLQNSNLRATATPAWTRRTIGASVVVALIVAAVAWRSRSELGCVRLDGPWMPEREAGALVASAAVRGRMLTWFDWGQYVIWHTAPRVRVSMDGRRETVYSDAFVARHLALYFQPEQEAGLLESLQPEVAWLPADLPLTRVLDDRGWHRLFTGPRSVIWTRVPIAPPIAPALGNACFPGP